MVSDKHESSSSSEPSTSLLPQHQNINNESTSVWQRIVEAEPLLSREPIHLTLEFKDRISAACRAAVTSLVTLSILIFSGQGKECILVNFDGCLFCSICVV